MADQIPTTLQVTSKHDDAPDRVAAQPPSLQHGGLQLARLLIWLICGLALVLLVFIASSEFCNPPAEVVTAQRMVSQAAQHYAAASEPDALKQVSELLQQIDASRKAQREYWISVAQLVLLNLLLPVLTAILGYVFGTRSDGGS